MMAIVILTGIGKARLIAEGQTQALRLNADRAYKHSHLIVVQNRNEGDRGEPDHDQGEAFLIVKISSVERSAEGRTSKRFVVKFEEYAEISLADFWGALGGLRNPIFYLDNVEQFLDPARLNWLRRSSAQVTTDSAVTVDPAAQGLSIAEAKKQLSLFYKVPTASIEIVIRG